MGFARGGRQSESGAVFVWLTGAALAASLAMIVGIVLLVASRGLVVFWPRPLIELSLKDGKKYIVEELAREQIPAQHEQPDLGERLQVRLANRDLYGLDFRWIPQSEIAARTVPPDAVLVERQEYGPFQGFLVAVEEEGRPRVAAPDPKRFALLESLMKVAHRRSGEIEHLEEGEIGSVNYALDEKRREIRALQRKGDSKSPAVARLQSPMSRWTGKPATSTATSRCGWPATAHWSA